MEATLVKSEFQGGMQSSASPNYVSSQYTGQLTVLSPRDTTHSIDSTALGLQPTRRADAHKVGDTADIRGSYTYIE